MPDLVQKVLMGQDPLHILGDGSQVRHYTYGGDLARGIVTAMEHDAAMNQDFNLLQPLPPPSWSLLSSFGGKSVAPQVPFHYVSDPPFEHDVAKTDTSVEKAKRVLGFEATTTLEDMLDEVIPGCAMH